MRIYGIISRLIGDSSAKKESNLNEQSEAERAKVKASEVDRLVQALLSKPKRDDRTHALSATKVLINWPVDTPEEREELETAFEQRLSKASSPQVISAHGELQKAHDRLTLTPAGNSDRSTGRHSRPEQIGVLMQRADRVAIRNAVRPFCNDAEYVMQELCEGALKLAQIKRDSPRFRQAHEALLSRAYVLSRKLENTSIKKDERNYFLKGKSTILRTFEMACEKQQEKSPLAFQALSEWLSFNSDRTPGETPRSILSRSDAAAGGPDDAASPAYTDVGHPKMVELLDVIQRAQERKKILVHVPRLASIVPTRQQREAAHVAGEHYLTALAAASKSDTNFRNDAWVDQARELANAPRTALGKLQGQMEKDPHWIADCLAMTDSQVNDIVHEFMGGAPINQQWELPGSPRLLIQQYLIRRERNALNKDYEDLQEPTREDKRLIGSYRPRPLWDAIEPSAPDETPAPNKIPAPDKTKESGGKVKQLALDWSRSPKAALAVSKMTDEQIRRLERGFTKAKVDIPKNIAKAISDRSNAASEFDRKRAPNLNHTGVSFRVEVSQWVDNIEKLKGHLLDPNSQAMAKQFIRDLFDPQSGGNEKTMREHMRKILNACTNNELLRIAQSIKLNDPLPPIVEAELLRRLEAATDKYLSDSDSAMPTVDPQDQSQRRSAVLGKNLQGILTNARTNLYEAFRSFYESESVEEQADTLRQLAGMANTLQDYAALLSGVPGKAAQSLIDDTRCFVAQEIEVISKVSLEDVNGAALFKLAEAQAALSAKSEFALGDRADVAAITAENVRLPEALEELRAELMYKERSMMRLSNVLDSLSVATAARYDAEKAVRNAIGKPKEVLTAATEQLARCVKAEAKAEGGLARALGDIAEGAAVYRTDVIADLLTEDVAGTIRNSLEFGYLGRLHNSLELFRTTGIFELTERPDELLGGLNAVMLAIESKLQPKYMTSELFKESQLPHFMEQFNVALPTEFADKESLDSVNVQVESETVLYFENRTSDDIPRQFLEDFYRSPFLINGNAYVDGHRLNPDIPLADQGDRERPTLRELDQPISDCKKVLQEISFQKAARGLGQSLRTSLVSSVQSSFHEAANDKMRGYLLGERERLMSQKLFRDEEGQVNLMVCMAHSGGNFTDADINESGPSTTRRADRSRSGKIVIAHYVLDKDGVPALKSAAHGRTAFLVDGRIDEDFASQTAGTERLGRLVKAREKLASLERRVANTPEISDGEEVELVNSRGDVGLVQVTERALGQPFAVPTEQGNNVVPAGRIVEHRVMGDNDEVQALQNTDEQRDPASQPDAVIAEVLEPQPPVGQQGAAKMTRRNSVAELPGRGAAKSVDASAGRNRAASFSGPSSSERVVTPEAVMNVPGTPPLTGEKALQAARQLAISAASSILVREGENDAVSEFSVHLNYGTQQSVINGIAAEVVKWEAEGIDSSSGKRRAASQWTISPANLALLIAFPMGHLREAEVAKSFLRDMEQEARSDKETRPIKEALRLVAKGDMWGAMITEEEVSLALAAVVPMDQQLLQDGHSHSHVFNIQGHADAVKTGVYTAKATTEHLSKLVSEIPRGKQRVVILFLQNHFMPAMVQKTLNGRTRIFVVESDNRRSEPSIPATRKQTIDEAFGNFGMHDAVDITYIGQDLQQGNKLTNACGPLACAVVNGYYAQRQNAGAMSFDKYADMFLKGMMDLPREHARGITAGLRARLVGDALAVRRADRELGQYV